MPVSEKGVSSAVAYRESQLLGLRFYFFLDAIKMNVTFPGTNNSVIDR